MSSGTNIEKLTLEDIMSDRFSRYSKSIIQERALPDVRDGLKPVQRRILYAMYKDGNTYDKGFRKSAKSVGNVMGNFHPHGDSSIYEALVRMSQEWKLRDPLIEMHGNNGSMDGDPAAAMRYTEARTSKIASEMLRDIDKDTVSWIPNFDDTEQEPVVLPSRFPNLLVNGATGISAGYATEIPPHNLGEVIDAVIYLQKHPDASLDDLMQFVKGPDFPTGGIIQGLDEIKKAYQTGRGRIVVRSKTSIEKLRGGKQLIRVTEIPYEVNKLQLVKQIDEIRINKKIDGIAEVRDESDRNGLSIAIELKRDVDQQGVFNYLLKNTDLQITYNFNVVAIDKMCPKRLSLKSILSSYLEYQRLIVSNRTKYDLSVAKKREHIVDGLIKALSILDKVINTIRESDNRKDASHNLVETYEFSPAQADSIVALQLYRLTNTDVTKLKAEKNELAGKINEFNHILDDSEKLDNVLKNELLNIKKEYGSSRKTIIEKEIENIKVSNKITIPDETTVVLVSHDGYLKRSSLRSYKASEVDDCGLKEDDYPIFLKQLSTRDHLFMFTNKGHLIYRPVFEITDVKWKDTGEHISQTIGLDADEQIINIFNFKALKENGMFVIATSDGYIKQTEFSKVIPGRTYRSHSLTYEKLKDDQSKVVKVSYVANNKPDAEIMIISNVGMASRFMLSDVSVNGPRTTGVKSIELRDEEFVCNMEVVGDNDKIGIITQKGSYKNMLVNEVPITSRGRRGVQILTPLKRNSYEIIDFAKIISNEESNIPLRIYTANSRIHDVLSDDYPMSNRKSNGSIIVDVKKEGIPAKISEIIS
ncbi:DNA topoisomerase (ATP-hydrolyzing) [Apilactobacillus ozensis DSM 23829 = JCM 17196]|uniref:DNA topoisomerase 4 subunit A n=1 Tax=Apilactobacillus ozensis DSM 23829 = JCM 17196 TaxID=1423781 RepID=A0A0R2AW30_9LACO|nr:DNA topoisomerase IV subunit A [Apilactobacillus ozensis]KRM67894.1 DNA topoisomerase (ATP-hydrolyzing) [Apilactobacillus ozensis DSM 23829 = JCM 17196]